MRSCSAVGFSLYLKVLRMACSAMVSLVLLVALDTLQLVRDEPIQHRHHALPRQRRHQAELPQGVRPDANRLVLRWVFHVVIVLYGRHICQAVGTIRRLRAARLSPPWMNRGGLSR